MNINNYETKSKELQKLVKTIPSNWGRVQNNHTDKKINMFNCESLDSLEREIFKLPENDKTYFRRRWFLWKCAEIDEFLFYKEHNVFKNPDHKDQSWDINFNNSICFDIKGTVVPQKIRGDFEINESFEKKIINFYYQNQSKGVRHNIQNRLFIVHHSFKDFERNMYLRCSWDLKDKAFKKFISLNSADKINLVKYNSVYAKCIFIIEKKDNSFDFKII